MFTQEALINEMGSLRRFALKLTRNVSDADDLVQSTVLRALEKSHLFEANTNLFSWSSKIMYNLFVSGYRRKVKFETQYDPESFIELERVEASQDMQMEFKETGAAMQRLSKGHREILSMVCIQGMSYEDVSAELGVPVGTVRSRLSRARENLQLLLDTPKTSVVMPFVGYSPALQQMAA